ncbi:MAG: alpha/beta fold hydrolase [Chloroflexi bacterium]|nr:alpha/beta fold hydrolase [Chloroflexota bacterium]
MCYPFAVERSAQTSPSETELNQRFQYPFTSNFLEVNGVRLHYLDEGNGPAILMIHGQPTWSYLYRKMIPPLVAAGYRCIVPDLMGFGLSDKPTDESEYTLKRHVELITGLVEWLEVRRVTMVGQDWGGPIGLRYAIENQENVHSLVILNTLVRPMAVPWFFKMLFQRPYSGFLIRRLDLFRKMAFRKGLMFKTPLDPQAKAEYKMPHPNGASRAGVAAFPKMIPTSERHPNHQYLLEIEQVLKQWHIPTLVMFSDRDVAFKADEGQRIAEMVPNGRFKLVPGAGHYLQEDAGEDIAAEMISFLNQWAAPERVRNTANRGGRRPYRGRQVSAGNQRR